MHNELDAPIAKPRVFIDYDRTLFDTEKFGNELLPVIATIAKISVEDVTAKVKQAKISEKYGGFDLDTLISDLKIDATDTYDAIETLLSGNDFLLPGAAEFIQDLQALECEPEILTFGHEEFQELKVSTYLHELQKDPNKPPIKYHITQEPKSEFIHQLAVQENAFGILLDDVDEQGLPQTFDEIHYAPSEHLLAILPTDHGYQVSTYPQALEAITLSLDSLSRTVEN